MYFMNLKNVILFVLFIQFACGNKTNLTVKEKIIADIEDQGFQFIGACKPPSGISDTLLVGYTDRHPKTGIFYLNLFKLGRLVSTFEYADP